MDVGILGFKGRDDRILPDGQIVIAPALDGESDFLARRRCFCSRGRLGGGRGFCGGRCLGGWRFVYNRGCLCYRCASTTGGEHKRKSNQQADKSQQLTHFLSSPFLIG